MRRSLVSSVLLLAFTIPARAELCWQLQSRPEPRVGYLSAAGVFSKTSSDGVWRLELPGREGDPARIGPTLLPWTPSVLTHEIYLGGEAGEYNFTPDSKYFAHVIKVLNDRKVRFVKLQNGDSTDVDLPKGYRLVKAISPDTLVLLRRQGAYYLIDGHRTIDGDYVIARRKKRWYGSRWDMLQLTGNSENRDVAPHIVVVNDINTHAAVIRLSRRDQERNRNWSYYDVVIFDLKTGQPTFNSTPGGHMIYEFREAVMISGLDYIQFKGTELLLAGHERRTEYIQVDAVTGKMQTFRYNNDEVIRRGLPTISIEDERYLKVSFGSNEQRRTRRIDMGAFKKDKTEWLLQETFQYALLANETVLVVIKKGYIQFGWDLVRDELIPAEQVRASRGLSTTIWNQFNGDI